MFTQHKTDRFNFDEATKEQDMAVTSDRWPTDTGGQEVSTNEKGLVEITTDFKPKVRCTITVFLPILLVCIKIILAQI